MFLNAASLSGEQMVKFFGASPNRNWKRWIVMKVSKEMPEIARFSLPDATV